MCIITSCRIIVENGVIDDHHAIMWYHYRTYSLRHRRLWPRPLYSRSGQNKHSPWQWTFWLSKDRYLLHVNIILKLYVQLVSFLLFISLSSCMSPSSLSPSPPSPLPPHQAILQLSVCGLTEFIFHLTRLNPDMFQIAYNTGKLSQTFFNFDINAQGTCRRAYATSFIPYLGYAMFSDLI